MTKRAYELLVRFGQGESVAGAHIKEMHLDENGNDLRETPPVPLADTTNPAFTAFADKFSAKTVSENEVLKSEKTTLLSEKATLESQVVSLTAQVETLTSEKVDLNIEKHELTTTVSTLTQEKTGLELQVTSLTSQVDAKTEQIETLITEKSELVASHAEEKSELILNHLAEKTTLTESLSAANARITFLLSEVPFDPREINVVSFKARLFQVLETEDVIRMYAADADPILKQIASTIANWDAAFPIRLDSQEIQQPLGYLVSINLLTPEEVVFLRKDCTRQEAYFTPENS
jgi:hypothetical protein